MDQGLWVFFRRFLVCLLVWSLPAWSQRGDRSVGSNMRRIAHPPNLTVAPADPGVRDSLKLQVLEDNLNAENTQLSWPPLPRAWLEYASTFYIQTNTFVGFRANPSFFEISPIIASKLSFDFRYQVKSAFVMIVSRDQNTESLFRFDGERMRTYPNPTQERPLVGLCIYESQFTYDRNLGFSVDVVGSGQSVTEGETQSITNTHFSQFFQIDFETAVDQYQHICETTYREQIEEQVNLDFSRQVMNYMFYNHPQSNCSPSFDENPPDGDPSCSEWFEDNIHPATRRITVARCELQNRGVHRCVLKARNEGISCPLYWTSEGIQSTRRTRRDPVVTPDSWGYPSYPCDESQGLQCQVEREPWMVAGVPIFKGEGRCRR